ncbi:MAG: GPP34 family phosphoprotein [Lysobacterales bacterium]
MLLGEDFLLLSLDVGSGLPLPGLAVLQRPAFLAACLLAELAVQKQVGWNPDGVQIFDELPSYHALISQALDALRRTPAANPADAIRTIGRELGDLRSQLLDSLISRGLLHEGGRRRYWLFGQRRYPVRSTRARNEAMEHLMEATTGRSASMRSTALLLLADATAANGHLLTAVQANEASARATALIQEVRHYLPEVREWSDTHSAIALLTGIAEALPHVM